MMKTMKDSTKTGSKNSSHPKELIIGNLDEGIKTRAKVKEITNTLAFISEVEPKNVEDALKDESWIEAMQGNFDNFRSIKYGNLILDPKIT